MRPLNNNEIPGICLFTRSGCLRSMHRCDEEIRTLDYAARYVPNTSMMKRIIQKSQQLAAQLRGGGGLLRGQFAGFWADTSAEMQIDVSNTETKTP